MTVAATAGVIAPVIRPAKAAMPAPAARAAASALWWAIARARDRRTGLRPARRLGDVGEEKMWF
jgi:hypothetical protein